MADALYGEGGFYRAAATPGQHFRTAAHTSPAWAHAMAGLCRRVDEALGRPDDFAVVDLGSGGGELITGIAGTAPERWRLVGVDVTPRPPALPPRVEWAESLPATFTGVLLAVEWLDVVPVDVAEQTESGARLVLVDPDGGERLGPPLAAADLAWLHRWWPLVDVGDRAEIGSSRDEAWVAASARLRRGVAVAVDYPAVPARDVGGTLTGYRDGRQTVPVPDGSTDLTAHVLMQSCAAAVEVDRSELLTQREALQRLGVAAERPAYTGDPASYVAALSAAGDAAELLDPGGLGGFSWLVQSTGTGLPF
jgi:SAM-dependent MidA family methyltransferase